ncbi:unnamed protein product [Effrenium voratum]|nr:unnamed protein product [Effrenium voratum]
MPMALAASAGRSAALGVLLARGWHGAQTVADGPAGAGYCLAGGGLGLLLSSEAGQNALWAACLLAGGQLAFEQLRTADAGEAALPPSEDAVLVSSLASSFLLGCALPQVRHLRGAEALVPAVLALLGTEALARGPFHAQVCCALLLVGLGLYGLIVQCPCSGAVGGLAGRCGA